MAPVRSAPSSRSWHECNDRVEYIVHIGVGIWVQLKAVEQFAAARHLAREQCAAVKVLYLNRYVSTRAAVYEPKALCRPRKKMCPHLYLKVACPVPSVWYLVWPSRVRYLLVCNNLYDLALETFFFVLNIGDMV